jgi:isopentenyl diphosphate isomerase/L-lactate dehydrogenase-like FMN-dependent dehydrogenase
VAAIGGEAEGVAKYFGMIKGQLTSAMALTGCATVADINKGILA